MSDVQLGPTAEQVLNFLRSQPREHFSPEEVAERLDCTPQQIRVALETLVSHDLVEKAHTTGGRDEYGVRS